METNFIKDQIVKNFEKSFGLVSSRDEWHVHPIRIVQAIKSLIGIDLDNPSDRLFTWLQLFMNQTNLKSNQFVSTKVDLKEVISIKQLHESVINKNILDSRKNLANLIKVSDGRPILEYLLEMSLSQNGISFLVIKSIIRSNMFMESKNIEILLYDSLNVLFDFEFLESDIVENAKGLSWCKYIEVLLSLVAMEKENFIRIDRFRHVMSRAENALNKFSSKVGHSDSPINLINSGRKGLIDFLNSLLVLLCNVFSDEHSLQ